MTIRNALLDGRPSISQTVSESKNVAVIDVVAVIVVAVIDAAVVAVIDVVAVADVAAIGVMQHGVCNGRFLQLLLMLLLLMSSLFLLLFITNCL